jgi:hypothetical protein
MMQRRATSSELKGQKSNKDVDRIPDHHDHSHSLFEHSHSHNGEDGSGHSHDAAHIVAALKGNKRELPDLLSNQLSQLLAYAIA